MVNNKALTLDLDRVLPQDLIQIHVNDVNSIFLNLTILKSGAEQDLTGCTIEYDATVAGVVAEQDAAGSVSNNKAVIPVTANMVAISGPLEIDVRIISGTEVLHTQTIRMDVARSVINGASTIDISGTTIYARLIAAESAATAATTAAAAATTAVGEKATKITSGTVNNFVSIGAGGEIKDSHDSAESFVRWESEVDTAALNTSDDYTVPSSKLVAASIAEGLAAKAPVARQITLASDGWSGTATSSGTIYTQTVALSGVTSASLVLWSLAASATNYVALNLWLKAQSTDSLTFAYIGDSAPSGTIKVNIIA